VKDQRSQTPRWWRLGALLGVLLLLAPILAACGTATPDPPTTGDSPTTEPAPTSAPTDAPTDIPPTEEATAAPPTEAATEAPPTEAAPDAEPGPVGAGGYPVLSDDDLQFGIVTHLYYTDHERALQLAQNAGFDWVRQQVHWKDTEIDTGGTGDRYSWDQLDVIVEAVNAYDLKLMVSIVRSPAQYTADGSDGLPEDPTNLGDFVEDMAERYGDQIHAYEIWNEQNLAHETGGVITIEDAGRYVEMVMESYTRIKAINPDAYVVVGAPSPTNFYDPAVGISDLEYFRAMYEYRDGIITDYFDVQGVHPAGSANPPDTLWPDNPSDAQGWNDHSTFYFRHVENVRDVMVEYGMDDHQIWLTEFGWATENVSPGYEYGNQVSFEDQAEYITQAMRRTYEEYPWIGNMFLWNLNFAVTWSQVDPPQPLHEQAAFGILNPDWSPRPSYLAIQGTIAQIKQEQGRLEQ
jgi:hypothetical protein